MVSLAIIGPNIYPQGDFLTTWSLRQDRQDSSGHGAGCGGNQSVEVLASELAVTMAATEVEGSIMAPAPGLCPL